jgi:drug/metabolite transporter (DMT)-like permease
VTATRQSQPQTRERAWLAYGALLLTISGIAWSAILIRWAGVPGPSSAFYRVFIAGLVLVPWWILWRRSIGAPRQAGALSRRAVLLALAGGALFALDLAFYNTAVMWTTATEATLLGNNSPIFVGIGSWLLFRQPPPRSFWAGLSLALAGAIVVLAGNFSAAARFGDLYGNLLALGAAVFFAGYLLATERVREELDTLTFSTIAIVGSVLTLIVVCVALGAPLSGFSTRTWGALLGLGLVSQLAAYFALVYALGHLPATITSVGLLAQVPLTALLAAALLGERLSVRQLGGSALVLAGIYIVNVGSSAVRQFEGSEVRG